MMTKELKALDRMSIHRFDDKYEEWDADYEIVENYLEFTNNSEPSEALECLRQIGVIETYHRDDGTLLKDSIMFKPEYDTIKQALLTKTKKEEVFEKIQAIMDTWHTSHIMDNESTLREIDKIICEVLSNE